MAAKHLNYFSTYLQTIEGGQPTGPIRVPLAKILRSRQGPVRYRDLWAAAYTSGYSRQQFADALRQLRAAGVLSIRSAPDDAGNPWAVLADGTAVGGAG